MGGGGGGIACLCYYLHVVYKEELLITFLNLTSVSSPRLLAQTARKRFVFRCRANKNHH